MSVTGVRSTPSVAALARTQIAPKSPVIGAESQGSVSLSRPAELLGKLEKLSRAEPAKFKEAADAIATKLGEAASAATDSHDKEMLTDLASRFAKAATTGVASGLKTLGGPPPGGGPGGPPPGGPPPGGGPDGTPPGGGAGGSARGGRARAVHSSDPADANRDGMVSARERAAYDAKKADGTGGSGNPEKSRGSASTEAYQRVMDDASRAQMHSLFSSLSSIVDGVIAK